MSLRRLTRKISIFMITTPVREHELRYLSLRPDRDRLNRQIELYNMNALRLSSPPLAVVVR